MSPSNPEDWDFLTQETTKKQENVGQNGTPLTTGSTATSGGHQGGKMLAAIEGWAPGAHQMHACSIARGLAHYRVPENVTAALITKMGRLDGATDPQALVRVVMEMYQSEEKSRENESEALAKIIPTFDLDLSKIYSNKSIFTQYLEYTKTVGETHPTNDFFCCMAAIAGALGNGVKIRAWDQLFGPNLWILLVGPSSANYKSSSIGHAAKILHDATKGEIAKYYDKNGVQIPALLGEKGERQKTVTRSNRYPKEFTMEAFYDYLKDRPGGLMAHGEWKAFFANLDKNYMVGSKETLTDLYDGTYLHKMLKSTEVSIEGTALSVLSATTPEWLESKVDPEDFTGGFYVRFIFVPVDGVWKASGIKNSDNWQARNELASKLKVISTFKDYEVDARILNDDFIALQTSFHDTVLRTQNEEIAGPISKRLAVSVLKMAVILEVAEGHPPRLTRESFRRAAIVGEWALTAVINLVGSRIATSGRDIERQCQQVMRFLSGEPRLRSEIARHMRGLSVGELARVKDTLLDRNLLVVGQDGGGGGRGRPKEVWEARK